jgi:hypothetical protein
MNDTKISKKFAVASAPVNKRLQTPIESAPAKISPNIQARLQQVRAKQRLGGSLAERLPKTLGTSFSAQALSAGEIMLALGGTISAIGLMLGLIQSSVLISGLGGMCFLGFGLKIFLDAKRKKRQRQESTPITEDFINSNDIESLDLALEKLAASASDETMEKLLRLKALLLRCVALMTNAQNINLVPSEDRFFVSECMRRYLPDSIRSYLQIPEKDRSTVLIEHNKSAIVLLHEQINMLAEQLTAKEASLIQLTGESLVQQQRFLSAKTKASS